MLTGESPKMSDIKYIGNAVKIARQYFRVINMEIYPTNTKDYTYLHECGADYVTVFQETYNSDKYETLHLAGHKRIFPYRFYSQERAILGGMRGVEAAAVLGAVGGNAAAAGGQVSGKSVDEGAQELKEAIDQYFEK